MGCGDGYELEYTEYVPAPAGGGGIINDSMALFDIKVTDYYCCGRTMGSGGGEKFEFRGSNLTLADIRTEKIYWQKKIPTSFYEINIIDSVLFYFQIDDGLDASRYINKIEVHRLGDKKFQDAKQIGFGLKEIRLKGIGWKSSSGIRVRPWQNELILTNSKYPFSKNNYALLDTVAGTMELWEPSGEFEWMNECADVKWSSVGGLCLKEIPDTLGFVLLKNGVDTLAVRYMLSEISVGERFMRNPLIFSGNGIIAKGWIYLVNEQGLVSEKSLNMFAFDMGTFYNSYGSIVDYYKKILY